MPQKSIYAKANRIETELEAAGGSLRGLSQWVGTIGESFANSTGTVQAYFFADYLEHLRGCRCIPTWERDYLFAVRELCSKATYQRACVNVLGETTC